MEHPTAGKAGKHAVSDSRKLWISEVHYGAGKILKKNYEKIHTTHVTAIEKQDYIRIVDVDNNQP
jgi:hypothetical protein